MEKDKLYLCGNTGSKCENPSMIKGTDLCYCDNLHLRKVDVEQKEKEFTRTQIETLQSEVYKITGPGEIMQLFNKLLGISAGK